jgi:hypothetical protein
MFRLFTRLFSENVDLSTAHVALKSHKAAIESLNEHVSRLELELKRLGATVEEHYAQLHKVRGKVYGSSAQQNRNGAGTIAYGDKDALRAHVGLSSARRFKHDEE